MWNADSFVFASTCCSRIVNCLSRDSSDASAVVNIQELRFPWNPQNHDHDPEKGRVRQQDWWKMLIELLAWVLQSQRDICEQSGAVH